MQVAFQPGPSGIAGKRARLPLPTRALPAAEMAKLRGQSDAMALRLRHHDDAVHQARMPAGARRKTPMTRIEQARVEAIGARHMSGVSANLRAKLTEECEAEGYDRMTRKDQLPVAEALALLARERMSGEPPPAPAQRILDLWRDGLTDDAKAALTEMSSTQDDQRAFTRAARKLLAALDLAEAESEAEPDDNNEEGEDGAEQSGQQDNSQDGEGQSESEAESMLGAQPDEMEGEAADDDGAEDAEEDAAAAEGDDRPGGPQQRRDRNPADSEAGYRAFTRQYDEEVDAEDLCDAEELARLRQQLDQQLQHLQGVISKLANRLQRKLMAQQTRAWEFDLEEGHARRRPAVAHRDQPDAGSVLQARARHRFPRYRRHAADRQFRLHARPADHRGRHVRRHPGPHAGTLRGEGGSARLHHPCLEGRPVTREMGAGRQAPQSRPAQRSAPHRLQIRRRALASRAQEPRPDAARGPAEGKHRRRGAAVGLSPPAGRSEHRRILMVISDGAPVDDSTLSVNPGNYLEKHLREVIRDIENRDIVELIAIGIGHDVTRYYRRAVTIVDAEELGGTMMKKLTELFDEDAMAAWGREAAERSALVM